MQKYVHFADLVKGFPITIWYLILRIGVNTVEKELLTVWGYGVCGIGPPFPHPQGSTGPIRTAQVLEKVGLRDRRGTLVRSSSSSNLSSPSMSRISRSGDNPCNKMCEYKCTAHGLSPKDKCKEFCTDFCLDVCTSNVCKPQSPRSPSPVRPPAVRVPT